MSLVNSRLLIVSVRFWKRLFVGLFNVHPVRYEHERFDNVIAGAVELPERGHAGVPA